MNLWLMMLAGGLLTYGIRLSFILLVGKRDIPTWLRQVLRFIPAAVFSAIIFPELFLQDGSLDISVDNNRLLAGLAAALVAWRTRNTILTILAGMTVLWVLQWIR